MSDDGRVEIEPKANLHRACFWTAVLSSAVVLAVMAAPMIAGKVYTYDDLGNLHLPLRMVYAQSLTDGVGFDWTNAIHSGFYLQGEGQAGMYHPLHWALYRFLPLSTAFNLEFFLPYPAALFGMYLLLKRWKLSPPAALLGAAGFALSGFTLLHHVHMHGVSVIAHIPWALLLADVLLGDQGRFKALAAPTLALVTASQVLLGIPHFVFLSVVVEALYVLVRWPRQLRALATLTAAKLVGLLAGAVQVLPTLDLLRTSSRFEAVAFGSSMYSLAPVNVVQFVAPYLFKARVATAEGDLNTHEYGLYSGSAVLVLALMLPFVLSGAGRLRRLGIAALVLSAVGLALAFGGHTPLFSLYSRIPLVGMLRAPARYILFVHMGLAVAAAVAFERILSLGRPRKRLGCKALVPAVLLVASVAAVVAAYEGGPLARFAAGNQWRALAGIALVAGAGAIVLAVLRGVRWAPAVLAFFLVADLGLYGLSYVYKKPPETIASYAPKISWQVDSTYYRLKLVPSYSNSLVLSGYRLSNGFGSFPPKTRLDQSKIDSLRLAGVKYLAADVAMVAGDRDHQGQRLDLRKIPNPMPRARLVTTALTADDINAAVTAIDIATTAVVAEKLSLVEGPPGTALITRDSPGDVTIATSAPSRQLLVFAERFHEGWTVAVDGEPADVVVTYGDFMGCVVEPGEHEARFVFEPESLRLGKQLSLVGLALTVALFFVSRVAFAVYRPHTEEKLPVG